MTLRALETQTALSGPSFSLSATLGFVSPCDWAKAAHSSQHILSHLSESEVTASSTH